MKTAAIILVPSEGFDIARTVGGLTSVHRIVTALKLAGVRRFVAAGGAELKPVELKCTRIGVEFIYSVNTKRSKTKAIAPTEQGSLLAAIDYLRGKCERVLIFPAAFPFAEISTLTALAETDAEVEIPLFEGKRGWPVSISASRFDAIAECGGDLQRFLAKSKPRKTETGDAGVVTDINDEDAAEAVAAQSTLRNRFRPVVKVAIAAEEAFWGPGISQLVSLTAEVQSRNQATVIMGMAITHAEKILRGMKENLHTRFYKYIDKGKYVTLEDDLLNFRDAFDAFEADVQEYARERFSKYFGEPPQNN